MQKKKLEELNLLDDFLFGSVVNYPGIGEEFGRIQKMVETVKKDREVSLEFMKIFEREEMLIRQGRREEQENTERERRRAEEAEKRAEEAEERTQKAEAELKRLKEELALHKG